MSKASYIDQLINCHKGTSIVPFFVYNKRVNKGDSQPMSTLHHEDILLSIFDEVCEEFPNYDEDRQIQIANQRFEDICQ